jgi:hypothetical protein
MSGGNISTNKDGGNDNECNTQNLSKKSSKKNAIMHTTSATVLVTKSKGNNSVSPRPKRNKVTPEQFK